MRDDRRYAHHFSLSVPAADAVATVSAELADWSVAVDEPFGRLLVDAGGRPRRHGRSLSHDLARDPAPPDWLEPPAPPGRSPAEKRLQTHESPAIAGLRIRSWITAELLRPRT